MKYKSFYIIVQDIFSHTNINDRECKRYWPNGNEDYYQVKWEICGASGGNCWGDDAEYYSSDDPEPEIELDSLFERVCPAISFLQYRKVMKDIIENDTIEDREYYGNYTKYGVKRVSYKKLYESLVTNGIISSD